MRKFLFIIVSMALILFLCPPDGGRTSTPRKQDIASKDQGS